MVDLKSFRNILQNGVLTSSWPPLCSRETSASFRLKHLVVQWPIARFRDYHHHNILFKAQRIGIAPPTRRGYDLHSSVATKHGASRSSYDYGASFRSYMPGPLVLGTIGHPQTWMRDIVDQTL
jgi:hypothetical protein